MILILGGTLAAAIPIIISVATGGWQVDNIETLKPEEFFQLLLGKWWLIAWVIVALTVIVIAAVAVHSFFQAGSMGIYLDGERLAGRAQMEPPRHLYRAFTPERWWAYGRRFWWPVFLIYNLAWGVFGLILLIPLVALTAAVLLNIENAAVAAIGCIGVAVIFIMLMVGGLLVTVWTDLAIAESVRATDTPVKSLGRGWRLLRGYVADAIIVVAVMIAVSIAVMMVVFAAYFVIGLLSSIPGLSIMLIPAQVALSFVQNVFSMFVAGWLLAAFASIAFKAQVTDVR